MLIRITFILFASTLLITTSVGAWFFWVTPSFTNVRSTALGSDRVLLSREGQVLQVVRTDFTKRRLAWYPLHGLAADLQQAVLQSEERRFYQHFGVDVLALGRAARLYLNRGPTQGASTITMQVTDLIQKEVLIANQRIQNRSWWHKGIQIVRALA